MKLNVDGDCVDPAAEHWPTVDDAALWHAAQAKVPQAVAELARRERLNLPIKASAE